MLFQLKRIVCTTGAKEAGVDLGLGVRRHIPAHLNTTILFWLPVGATSTCGQKKVLGWGLSN